MPRDHVHSLEPLTEHRALLHAQHLFRERLRALLLQDPANDAFGAGLNSAVIDLLEALRASRRRLQEGEE